MGKGRDRIDKDETDASPSGYPSWFRLPVGSIRMRLTVAYWLLFIVSGAAMLLLTVGLWHGLTTGGSSGASAKSAPGGTSRGAATNIVTGIDVSQHSLDSLELVIAAGVALAVAALPAMALGWLVAGHYLRPLRTITGTVRDISATNLDKRLNLSGPDDEIKELGDTFDNLLGRLERSFQTEQRFVANASHELLTPLSTMRALLDVAIAKPDPLPPPAVRLAERLRHELDHMDRLVDSFLTLAHTQQAPEGGRTTVSLDSMTATAIERRSSAISVLELSIDVEHDGPIAWLHGNEILLSQMVDNVIDNAVKHNQPGGWIHVTTSVDGPYARLVVENGGHLLDQDEVSELARPFQRLGTERIGSRKGSGLGLSIVDAIAQGQGGTLHLHARNEGGLRVTLDLPVAPGPPDGAQT